jgi:N-acetylglucosaminyldiphosphoundecaprenol N-acetyl-beta-D-mannosaminyltransferase
MGKHEEKQMDRVNILGVGVSAINMQIAFAKVEQWIERREPNYVIAVPAHCIVECLRSETLRKVYNRAGMVTPDGRPIAWICRLMGYRHVEQVRGSDLMLEVCKRSVDRGYRHFLYGGWPPDVVEKLAIKLRERCPGIQIVGTYAPPFRPLTPDEDAMIKEKIDAARPDIVWIGLGAAKEEFWAEAHIGKLLAPVLIGVGAAFDFHSGVKPQAPRWMVRVGLEWFFRVLTEPRRLGPRYLRDNPVFIWNILRQAMGKAPPPI